jgi:hypothetical protein
VIPDPPRWFCLLFSMGALVVAVVAISRALQVRRVPALWGQAAQVSRPYRSGLLGSELLLFAIFLVGFYLLEVYASYGAPYYLYPPIWLPRLPAILPGFVVDHVPDSFAPDPSCGQVVTTYLNSGDNRWHAIPLEVPLMEATLAYVMYRTTRLLGSPAWARPLLAAAALLALDAVLDPAVAEVHDCKNQHLATGAGLWRWFLDESRMQSWQMIPLINYGAWYSGALLAVAAGQVVTTVAAPGRRRRASALELLSHGGGAGLGVIALLVVWWCGRSEPVWKTAAALLVLVATVVAAAVATRRSASTNHRPRLAFIAPVLFFLAIALLAYAWFGLQSAESKHIVEAFGALLICLSLTFLPYWRRLL